jgi:hypothetical protein
MKGLIAILNTTYRLQRKTVAGTCTQIIFDIHEFSDIALMMEKSNETTWLETGTAFQFWTIST